MILAAGALFVIVRLAQSGLRRSDSAAELGKGYEFLKAWDFDLAISHANEVLRRGTDRAGGLLLRAQARHQKGNHQAALADIEELLAAGPNAVAYFVRGEIYLDMEEYERAIADFSDAIRLDPGS